MSLSTISFNSEIPNFYQEYRCPVCSLIPFINLSIDNNNYFMSIKCTNNHSFSKSFNEMENICKLQNISNFNCNFCENEKKNKITDIEFYCSNCFKIFCYEHGKVHNLQENHKIFSIKKIDSICTQHNNTIIGYCFNHNKNYCKFCEHCEENNKKIDDQLNKDQIQKYQNQIKNNEDILKQIDILYNNYKQIFEDFQNNYKLFKENMNKVIEFNKEIINFYIKKINNNEFNYQMRANIENNSFDLSKIKEKIQQKINTQIKETNEMLMIFKNKIDFNQ